MANPLNNPEKTSTAADQSHTPTTNEEILTLLRQLVGQGTTANEQAAPRQNPQKAEAEKDASTEEVKRLLEEVLKQKTAPVTVATDDDATGFQQEQLRGDIECVFGVCW